MLHLVLVIGERIGRVSVAGLAAFVAGLAATAYLNLGPDSTAFNRDPRLAGLSALFLLTSTVVFVLSVLHDVIVPPVPRRVLRWIMYIVVALYLWSIAVYGWSVGGYFVVSGLFGMVAAVFAHRAEARSD